MILHGFGIHHVIAAAAARSAGCRAIACAAGNTPPTNPEGRRAWAAVVRGSRVFGCPIASCSNAVEQQLKALGALMPRGSFPIPNGLEIPPEILVRSCPKLGRPWIIGMVARLDSMKDHQTIGYDQ